MTKTQTRQIEADVVVIGAGGAGLPAAVEAFEQGAERVVVLEKRNNPGGNAVFASGIFACESPIHRKFMVDVPKDKVFKQALDWHHHSQVNPRILRAYINNSGDTIRWLMDKGIEFEVGPEMMMYFGQEPTWHIAMNPQTGDLSRFAQVFRMLAREIQDHGGQILTKTDHTHVVTDADGRVCAVEAIHEGTGIRIATKTAIIATGGFIGNTELLKKYFPYYEKNFGGFFVPMMGDGIRIAAEAGAALEDYATLVKEAPASSDEMPERSLALGCREPYALWVNKLGQRFTDEAVGAHLQTCTNIVMQQPGKQAYALIDSAMVEDVRKHGWVLPRYPSMDTDTKFLDQITAASQKGVWSTTSSDWDDIAAWIGAGAATLRASVDEYNASCSHGYDDLFAKDRRYMRPLLTPPFFAIRFGILIIETCGPVRVNERMQVLTDAYKAVPGLYAAGAITSGWLGHDYCGDYLFGTALGYAMASGRIAGKEAARYAAG